MKIAMVSSEANPLAKTGGLADVIPALSREMKKLGDQVIIAIPLYQCVYDYPNIKLKEVASYDVQLGWRKQRAVVYKAKADSLDFYLIGNDYYFRRDRLYGYGDDGERFAFFTLAVKDLFKQIGFAPDIIHTHDWQPGMLPCLIKVQEKDNPIFKNTKFVHTIHNPEFKGFLHDFFLGDFYGLPHRLFDDGSVRFENQVSTLKTAIVYADKITTVSPSHAQELLTPEGSKGLSSVLNFRKDDFVGIVNGIDEEEWDPTKDPFLPHKLKVDPIAWKAKCRKALLEEVGLKDTGGPLFGLVSRLTFQKGIDLVLESLRGPLSDGAMLFLLGSGEYELEQGCEALRREFPSSVCIYIGYSNKRAHQIYASSDFFLMPSLFEPCGIGQLIAEHYGSLPIGRATGGLQDTIVSYNGTNREDATGVIFKDYNVEGLNYGVYKALEIYRDKPLLEKMIANAMNTDNGWALSGKKYRDLYLSLK